VSELSVAAESEDLMWARNEIWQINTWLPLRHKDCVEVLVASASHPMIAAMDCLFNVCPGLLVSPL
jgi:hypothetical protein